jgi:hypothetical protein
MKVAQHFSAGLVFFDRTVPVGMVVFRCRSPKKWADELSFDRPYRDGHLFPTLTQQ